MRRKSKKQCSKFVIFRSDCLQVQEQAPCLNYSDNFDNFEENEIVQLSRRVKRQLVKVRVKVMHPEE